MTIDPISDMFTRIRNAIQIKSSDLEMPSSKLKLAILKVMKQEHLIEDFQRKQKKGSSDYIIISLKYDNNIPAIHNLERVSKPGLRTYAKANRLPKTLVNWGVVIISTPQGIMTGREAKKKGIGGEIICRIW